jgi:hypothetical protein
VFTDRRLGAALNLAEPASDTETECATLDEALCHLRELILSEMEDEKRPSFDCYGITPGRQ